MARKDPLISLLAGRKGHFRLESGHHGDLWLDLDLLLLRPVAVRPFVIQLAERIRPYAVQAVCGPLTGGAFVAEMVAVELDVEFYYALRLAPANRDGLFTVDYRIPDALREQVRGRRIAIVNDVISAGSAVRGTFADLQVCGARSVAMGTLLTLGSSAARFAAENQMPLEALAALDAPLWVPDECPLCAGGVPLEDRSA
jgi:orotate phosphoribosyltransferase